jgi:hypothetical protein
VPKAVRGAVVVVTNLYLRANIYAKASVSAKTKLGAKASLNAFLRFRNICLVLCFGAFSLAANATVLPEDRTDILYHSYEGGGMVIDGPSVLVRKQFKNKVSVWGNYYIDMISSASIDVMTQGSSYVEERTEQSFGFDYLHDRTTISLAHTNSSEEDYSANTVSFGLSQEFFGDMTTLSMNYSKGEDEVGRNLRSDGEIVSTTKVGDATHQRFGIGLTQVLTKKLIVALNVESVIDGGFLNNAYRSVRILENGSERFQSELYPTTHNSDAVAFRSLYYLPWRSSVRFEYKAFADSWGIEASNVDLRYIHPIGNNLVIEAKYRTYEQTQANFYSDLINIDETGLMPTTFARDKELSEFSDVAFGLGISYEIPERAVPFFDKATVNLFWDGIQFDYTNFRENTDENQVEFGVGNEPLYAFNANVIRFFISVNY